MPSSGGGGGGSSSGRVDYPKYMKQWHADILGIGLDGTGNIMTSDIATVIDAKIGASPFAALSPYDPAAQITAMESAVTNFKTLVDAMSGEGEWTGLLAIAVLGVDSEIYDTTEVNAAITAYDAIVDAEIANVALPRFRRGMQDLNAVNTSAFVVGAALIEAEGSRNKDKYAADLHLQNRRERTTAIMAGVDSMVKLIAAKLDIQRALTQATLEQNRLTIIANKEETDQDIHLSELDGKWDLEVFNYAGNILASIGSASVRTGVSTGDSGLGGLGMAISGIGAILGIGGIFGI